MNKYKLSDCGLYAIIDLTRGFCTSINVADLEHANKFKWRVSVQKRKDGSIRSKYAISSTPRSSGSRGAILLHRHLMKPPHDLQVDHINGNGLDNRRFNLRIANKSENQQNSRTPCNNTSGNKGVFWHKNKGKWMAQIGVNGKNIYLGIFKHKCDAEAAYVKASKDIHKEFSRID